VKILKACNNCDISVYSWLSACQNSSSS